MRERSGSLLLLALKVDQRLEKVPDAKTLARRGQVIPEVIGELHERLMELARERGWCKD
jgi:hypothetical protein